MPRIDRETLGLKLAALYSEAGLDREEARILSEILISAEMSGRKTHGLIRVPAQIKRLRARGHQAGVWVHESEGAALYDGQDGLGYLVAYHCTVKAIELAGRSGVAVVGARGASHTGPMNYFAGMCAAAGLVGLCLANCSPLAAPFGASSPVLGTNPIAAGIPFDPEPIVVDLATTAITYGNCQTALHEGCSLPEGVALDREGRPTTDPYEALHGGALLPFGGHKGYALGLMVQILTSAFTGAASIPEQTSDYGFLVIALRRDLLVSRESFGESVGRIVEAVKAARPADPGHPARIPGERSAALKRIAEKEGIEVPQQLYEKIFGGGEA